LWLGVYDASRDSRSNCVFRTTLRQAFLVNAILPDPNREGRIPVRMIRARAVANCLTVTSDLRVRELADFVKSVIFHILIPSTPDSGVVFLLLFFKSFVFEKSLRPKFFEHGYQIPDFGLV